MELHIIYTETAVFLSKKAYMWTTLVTEPIFDALTGLPNQHMFVDRLHNEAREIIAALARPFALDGEHAQVSASQACQGAANLET